MEVKVGVDEVVIHDDAAFHQADDYASSAARATKGG
jgi:hypothetical protein